MFNFIRGGAKSILGVFLFGAISLTFILSFGPGSSGCQRADKGEQVADYVVKIGKDTIGEGLFREKYKTLYLQYRSYGQEVSVEDITKISLNQLVDDYIYIKEAEKLGLKVDVSERNEYIKKLAYFQVDGQFDYDKYENIVSTYFNTTPVQFEENMDRDILILKVKNILTSPITVAEEEIWDMYSKVKKSVKLSFVKISPAVEKDNIEVTDAEVEALLKDKTADVQKYFDDNKDKYKHAEEVKASHILVKVDKNKKDEAAKKEIEGYLAELKKEGGKDFETMAKEHSDCPSKEKGGDLGYFTRDRMVKPFSDKAFSMKEIGELSDVVKTEFGYHIIKLTDKKAASEDKFDDVKTEIAKTLVKDAKFAEAAKKAKEDADLLYQNNKTLDDIVKAKPELKIEETESLFTYSTYIPGIGKDEQIIKDAFASKTGEFLPQVYDVNSSFFIISAKEITEPNKDEFEKEKESLKESVSSQEKTAFLTGWIEGQRKKLSISVHDQYIPEEKK